MLTTELEVARTVKTGTSKKYILCDVKTCHQTEYEKAKKASEMRDELTSLVTKDIIVT